MSRRKAAPVRFCMACGAALLRKLYGGRLEDLSRFRGRKLCDNVCRKIRGTYDK